MEAIVTWSWIIFTFDCLFVPLCTVSITNPQYLARNNDGFFCFYLKVVRRCAASVVPPFHVDASPHSHPSSPTYPLHLSHGHSDGSTSLSGGAHGGSTPQPPVTAPVHCTQHRDQAWHFHHKCRIWAQEADTQDSGKPPRSRQPSVQTGKSDAGSHPQPHCWWPETKSSSGEFKLEICLISLWKFIKFTKSWMAFSLNIVEFCKIPSQTLFVPLLGIVIFPHYWWVIQHLTSRSSGLIRVKCLYGEPPWEKRNKTKNFCHFDNRILCCRWQQVVRLSTWHCPSFGAFSKCNLGKSSTWNKPRMRKRGKQSRTGPAAKQPTWRRSPIFPKHWACRWPRCLSILPSPRPDPTDAGAAEGCVVSSATPRTADDTSMCNGSICYGSPPQGGHVMRYRSSWIESNGEHFDKPAKPLVSLIEDVSYNMLSYK